MNPQTTAEREFQAKFGPPPRPAQQDTICREIRRLARLQPDRAAVVSTAFTPLSYRELQSLIDETRAALRLAGFGRTARIVIAMRDGPQAALAIVTVACAAVSIPLNPRQSLSEVETCLSALRPDALLVLKGADSAARRVAERKGIATIEATPSIDGTPGFSIVGEPTNSIAAAPDETAELDHNATAFILQTSGTSAVPKFIPVSHRNMLASAARIQAWFALTPQDCCLSVIPLFYSQGLTVTCFTPLLTGGTVAFPTNANRFDYSEWFSDLKPTWYSAGPTLHRLVLDHLNSRVDAKVGHSLRFVWGAPFPRDVLEGLQLALGVPVLEHYGSSEAAQIASNLLTPGRSKTGTCGVPWPDTIRIVGDSGQWIPSGERGEILVGGPTVISGYLDAPDLTRTSFIDGWFRSGDIGSLDEDGFLTLQGRISDLINRGGEKIAPLDVESVALLHPDVREAAAYGVPHQRLGENVAMAVVLEPGAAVTASDLRNFVRDRLPAFKVPQRIDIVEALPRNNTGKVLKSSLRDLFTSGGSSHAPPEAPLEFEIAEVWKRLLKNNQIGIDDDFFESNGDSLLAEQMLLEIESIINHQIPVSALSKASTIRGLAAIAASDNYWGNLDLVTKVTDAPGTPFFFCHGDYSTRGFYALKLARLIEPSKAVYLVHPLRNVDESTDLSIESMARLYVPTLLAVRPEGLFQLGGYCNGGLLALEIARQLTQSGRRVELVLLIESVSINCRWPLRVASRMIRILTVFAWPRKFRQRLARSGMLSVWELLEILLPIRGRFGITWSIRDIARRLIHFLSGERKTESAAMPKEDPRDPAYHRAMANYLPPRIDGKIVAIICEEAKFDAFKSPRSWRSRAPVIHHATVPGDHLGCITRDVAALSECMSTFLKQSRAAEDYNVAAITPRSNSAPRASREDAGSRRAQAD
jgi:oxalate---CoA ligase